MIIIPDVHGRTFWRKAVNEYIGKEPILFLGDYLDPYAYEGITPSGAFQIFHEIIDLKKANPQAITLLLGNHDLHYLNPAMEGGRLDYSRKRQIIEDVTENAGLFRIAESAIIGDKKYLFTHAGVKSGWIQKHKETLGNPESEDIAGSLNSLWLDVDKRPMLLQILADVPFCRWGNSLYGSPIWNDVGDIDDSLEETPGYIQVFGHTQLESEPVIGNHFMCLDVRCAFRLSDNVPIQALK
ncbi:MAG: metallophosphoesterase [Bacteroidales bacterium]|nr:metallophosphoesterase [Bacteroidales bacterium]